MSDVSVSALCRMGVESTMHNAFVTSYGWLSLQPPDWRYCLTRQIEERDRLNDPYHSGPAPAFVKWVASVQLPALAHQPFYKKQFLQRIAELEQQLYNLEHQIRLGRLDLEPDAHDCRVEIAWLDDMVQVAV